MARQSLNFHNPDKKKRKNANSTVSFFNESRVKEEEHLKEPVPGGSFLSEQHQNEQVRPAAERTQRGWTSSLLSFLFPPKCPCCGQVFPSIILSPNPSSEAEVNQDSRLCPDCLRRLPFVGENYCLRCGAPVEETEEICWQCRTRDYAFDAARALLLYSPEVSHMIYRFKKEGEQDTGRILGQLMAKEFADSLRFWNPSLIVPVPLHKSRERSRGYNQSELLAKPISLATGISLVPHALLRTQRTQDQKNLSRTDRLQNQTHAFVCPVTFNKEETVLLVDDVLTTGSTAHACAAALKAAGARHVYVAVAAISSKQ